MMAWEIMKGRNFTIDGETFHIKGIVPMAGLPHLVVNSNRYK